MLLKAASKSEETPHDESLEKVSDLEIIRTQVDPLLRH